MIPGSANPLLMAAAQDTGYNVSRSLRFNAPDSAYLSRTPGSAGNRKTWTFSCWVKRASLGRHVLLSAYINSSDYTFFQFDSSDRLAFEPYTNATTAAVFRDFSAWYHIVCAVNTTLATQADRVKIYVNGVRQALSTSTAISQNADTVINSANIHNIASGYYGSPSVYANAYIAEIFLIDGQELGPSSFAETNATTGQWVPKAFSGGSYGTNGFKLDFADNSAATAAALGKDTSGNGNNWTPNNLSVTAGAGNDSLVDTPTSYGTGESGGDVRGNYCTWNPLSAGNTTLSNGNLSSVTLNQAGACGTMQFPPSGKWLFELTFSQVAGQYNHIGIIKSNPTVAMLATTANTDAVLYRGDGNIYRNTGGGYSVVQTVSSYTSGDVIGVAVNNDASTIQFYKNGSTVGTAISLTAATEYTPFIHHGSTITSGGDANFGQRPFAYTAPSGFKALCDTNLPTPMIVRPSTAMDVVIYTGTGATLTPTSSLGFSPDLVWIKSRSAATDNTIYDAVRGAQARLESNNTDAELTSDGGLTAFNSNGFTLGTLAQVNTNAATYVAWCWDEAAADGFDIVTYTGNGANRTIAHSLGVAPSFMIIKQRTAASTTNWAVWHSSLANTEYLLLNSTAAKTTGATYWNSTSPTSSMFSLGTSTDVNANSGTYVAYLWSAVANFSAFGSYTGNGSTDGPFVYSGFRPRWIMIKSATSSSNANWIIRDTARSSYNAAEAALFPNLSNSEIAAYTMDILSNGFKPRTTNSEHNESGQTYIYAAFAESPFQYARAR